MWHPANAVPRCWTVLALLTVLRTSAIHVQTPSAPGDLAQKHAERRGALTRAPLRVREVAPGSADAARAGGGGCGAAGGALEGLVDELSWDLLRSPRLSAAAEQRGPAAWPGLFARHRAGADHQLQEEALARLSKWQDAVQRAQEQQRRAAAFKETAAAGARAGNDTVSALLPPACPSHVPLSDPYWAQSDSYAFEKNGTKVFYNECRYSRGCRRQFTNRERVDSIRRVLEVTKSLLTERKIQFVLYGGSAIGAFRCKDVLPWDVDSDVLVNQEQLDGLLDLLKGAPNGTGSNSTPDSRGIDMASIGFPGFSLMEKFPGCQPLVVVDQSTGFFTDVFPMRRNGSEILSPWWAAETPCNATKLFKPCHHQACIRMSVENTLPVSQIKVHDSYFPVAHNLGAWLKEQYGSSVAVPDVHTADSAPSKVVTEPEADSIPHKSTPRADEHTSDSAPSKLEAARRKKHSQRIKEEEPSQTEEKSEAAPKAAWPPLESRTRAADSQGQKEESSAAASSDDVSERKTISHEAKSKAAQKKEQAHREEEQGKSQKEERSAAASSDDASKRRSTAHEAKSKHAHREEEQGKSQKEEKPDQVPLARSLPKAKPRRHRGANSSRESGGLPGWMKSVGKTIKSWGGR